MVSSDKVERSKQIQKQTGKTFYFATKLLPEDIRHETYVLYAFFRKADEIVDSKDPDPNQGEKLENFRKEAKGQVDSEDAVIQSFNEVRENKDIRDKDIDGFIDAMKMDIEKNRYETFEEVRQYMDGSASAVGRMMTSIMNPENKEEALPHATSLGEAYQMTNFLRDVGEDIRDYDRVYLPKSTREEFDVSVEQIRNGEVNDDFKRAIEEELKRTEVLYKEGIKGIKHLPENSQFGVFVSAVLYSQHHHLIRSVDYDVLNQTPELKRRTKLKLIASSYWHWKRSETPLEAFRKSSSIYKDSNEAIGSDGRILRDFKPSD